jgi:hypothetical protein
MPINGLPPQLSHHELQQQLAQGAKFVVYEYTVSILIMTFRRSSDVHYIRPNESALVKGLPYTLLTLFAGWWGIPWGPIYSVMCLATNLGGGKNVTSHFNNPP